MKSLFVAVFVSCFTIIYLSSPAFSQEITIFGDASYPPYSFLNNNQPAGVYVDIIKKAFTKFEGYSLNITLVPWKRGISYIKNGNQLALFPPYYTEERSKWMTYSEPILPERTVLYGKPEKLSGKKKWPEDFYGSTIAINSGFSIETMGTKALQKAADEGKITIDEQSVSVETNLKKLEKDRVDFYINDQMIDISEVTGIIRGLELKKNDGYLGFTKNTDKFPFIPDLLEKFNKAVKEMKSSGEINEILKSYQK